MRAARAQKEDCDRLPLLLLPASSEEAVSAPSLASGAGLVVKSLIVPDQTGFKSNGVLPRIGIR